ncbi:hypothetical protein FRC03_000492 [Tulasnella sp. 419]|nr:hypothetical protein FRC03_000492 [Tulasnella sp. 419]
MSLSQMHDNCSSDSSSSSGSSFPHGTSLYVTKSAVVANIPGQRPRVIASSNGPLRRTEAHDRLDLPRGERERSVGVSTPQGPARKHIKPLIPSEISTHRLITPQPRAKRGTKRKAKQLYNEPTQPPKFSQRLREKKEKDKWKSMQSMTQRKAEPAAKRRKVE